MWFKSSYSNGGDNCLEVAVARGAIAVRDSKSPALGTLIMSAASFSVFVDGLVTTSSSTTSRDPD